MRARAWAALAAGVMVVQTGCLTAEMWEAYTDSTRTRVVSERTIPGAGPESIQTALRSGDGVYHFEVRYDDGTTRHLVLDPATTGSGEPPEWPSAGELPERPCGQLPLLLRSDLPVPAGALAVALEVVGADPPDPGPPPTALDLRGEPGPSWPQVRLAHGCLELREGHDAWLPVARFPRDPDGKVVERAGPGMSAVALGAGVVLATPVTIALEVAFWGAVVGVVLTPVALPIVCEFL